MSDEEEEDEADRKDYQSLRSNFNVIDGTVTWETVRIKLRRGWNDYNPRSIFEGLNDAQRQVFWSMLSLLHTYVESFGAASFYGSVEYRWNAAVWLSIIMRVARDVSLDVFSEDNCWMMPGEERPTMIVRCHG